MKRTFIRILAMLIVMNSCKKDSLPVVETQGVITVDATHITLLGNILSEGVTAVTVRGFCWGLTPNPTFSDNYSENEFGPGAFTHDLEVISDTMYHFRAYASNTQGTAFSEDATFKTIGGRVFTDSRDSREYHWIKIGNQVWMAENLAYLPSVSPSSSGSDTSPFYYVYGYEGTSVSAAKGTTYATYGVLYNWEAAKTACPTGWHLPTDAEWMMLEKYLGMSETDTYRRNSGMVVGKLKEPGTTHWRSPNTDATNSSGFTALPGGNRDLNGGFYTLGNNAHFWSSSEVGTSHAWVRSLGYLYDGVDRSGSSRRHGFSVRCLQN